MITSLLVGEMDGGIPVGNNYIETTWTPDEYNGFFTFYVFLSPIPRHHPNHSEYHDIMDPCSIRCSCFYHKVLSIR